MGAIANVSVPGVGKLAYREVGAGSPLILIHGSPGDGRSWSRLVPRLGKRYRVITPDLPGHGGSDALPENTSERAAARALDRTHGRRVAA
jgi:pimeloyl-ACP methyl ester carboxylesterase